MRAGGLAVPMGGEWKIIGVDDVYHGKVQTSQPRSRGRVPKPTKTGRSGPTDKRPVISLAERGGAVRSFHVAAADKATVAKIVRENAAEESLLQTDESRRYVPVGVEFAAHETVRHEAEEYARGDATINSVAGFCGISMRSMVGIYQHCADKLLHQYMAEYDFRYSGRMKLG